MPKPLRVLVTRPQPHTEALCALLERTGIVPVSLPLLQIEADTEARHHSAWESVAQYDWVVFTSANGVDHAWPHAAEALRHHPRIAAVGPATARAISHRGGHVHTVAPIHIAESLADALGDVAGTRILWPRGSEAREVLSDRLQKRGALTVDEIVVYHTRPAPLPADAAERVTGSDIATLASPSAARRFVECFGTTAVPHVVCIGPVTAAAAHAGGLRVDAVAESYTVAGLLDALAEFHG